jgi:hypothetical protein
MPLRTILVFTVSRKRLIVSQVMLVTTVPPTPQRAMPAKFGLRLR